MELVLAMVFGDRNADPLIVIYLQNFVAKVNFIRNERCWVPATQGIMGTRACETHTNNRID